LTKATIVHFTVLGECEGEDRCCNDLRCVTIGTSRTYRCHDLSEKN